MSAILNIVIIPILAGIILFKMDKIKSRKVMVGMVGAVLATCGTMILSISSSINGMQEAFHLYLNEYMTIAFLVDEISIIFVSLTTIVWFLCAIYGYVYMTHESNERQFWGCYLIVYGIIVALDFSANLITFYIFYEFMTLTSLLLVLHNKSRKAVMAGLKYLFYSFFGAQLVLFGIYFLTKYANTNLLTFSGKGILDIAILQGNEGFLLVIAMMMMIGFGVKAGAFPFHAWLTSAHPVAPSPASAVLSGIIVKAGILGNIRLVYFIFGIEFLQGTWVQSTWIILCLITIFMGSMLAFRTKILKLRLAYSTISQLSYILLGLAFMTEHSFIGAISQVVVHGITKAALFLIVGTIIFQTGKRNIEELEGMGKQMPILMILFTIASLSLIGIPPLGGFVSKWYLGIGALDARLGILSLIAPIVLIISALLTAGYLLPIAIMSFYPKQDIVVVKKEAPLGMLIAISILIILIIFIGCYPEPMLAFISSCFYGV